MLHRNPRRKSISGLKVPNKQCFVREVNPQRDRMDKLQEVTWPSTWTYRDKQDVREKNLRGNMPLLIPGATAEWPLSKLAHLPTKSFLASLLSIVEQHTNIDEPLCAAKCCACEPSSVSMSLREYVTTTWLAKPDAFPPKLPPLQFLDAPMALKDALELLRTITTSKPDFACDTKSCNGSVYLKDLHLDINSLATALYRVPPMFADDFLNPFFKHQYRFLYVGTSSTFTPLHADVLRSFSWTANVRGRKAWLLFPPTQKAEHLAAFEQVAGLDLRGVKEADLQALPSHCFFMVQPEGSAFFVPSNWYHAVFNLDPLTLSINHNWFNATNIMHVFEHLKSQELSIRKELSAWSNETHWQNEKKNNLCDSSDKSSDENYETVQTILKANAALDRKGLRALLLAAPRLDHLENDADRAAVATVLGQLGNAG